MEHAKSFLIDGIHNLAEVIKNQELILMIEYFEFVTILFCIQ